MPDRRGFVLIDVLMEGVAVVGVLAVVGIAVAQLASAGSGLADARRSARFELLRRDLEELRARQAIHYADELTYSSSFEALRYQGSPGVSVTVSATGGGWAAAATHSRLEDGEGCALYAGHASPPGAPLTPPTAGEIACTD